MPLPPIKIENLVRIPPMILGTIRWKKAVGIPAGDFCAGFDILVEEKTPTEYIDAGGGVYIPEKGTGIVKPVLNAVTCKRGADEDDYYVVHFQVSGLHHTVFPDGSYTIRPTLKGTWRPSGLLAALSYRLIEPFAQTFVLPKSDPLKVCSFEVTRRRWFSGSRF